MNDWLFWILLTLLFVIIGLVLIAVMKRVYMKRVMKAVEDGDFARAERIIDSFGCKYAYPPFSRESIRLNAYLTMGDKEKVNKQMDMMMKMRLNRQQKASIAMRAFYYFVELGNVRKADEMIKIVKENGSETIAKELNMISSVLLHREAKYIREFKELYDKADADYQKGVFAYMLGLQYSYKKDDKNMKVYLQEALEKLKGTPYEEEINKVLQPAA